MRLTNILLRRNRMPNGNIFRGKERFVKEVKGPDLRKIRRDFELEEQNMFFLRFPYLTEEQNFGHAKALGKHEARRQKLIEQSRNYFKQDVTLAERLLHLRSNEKWE